MNGDMPEQKHISSVPEYLEIIDIVSFVNNILYHIYNSC